MSHKPLMMMMIYNKLYVNIPCLSPAAEHTGLNITRGVKDVAVKAGESATFECHIVGPSEVDVDWLSNGKLVQPALLNCKMHFDGKRCGLFLQRFYVCRI